MSTKLKQAISVTLAVLLLSTSVCAAPMAESTALTAASYTEITRDSITNAPDFNNGLVLARKNGTVGFLNQNGDEVIPFIYSDAYSFADGTAPVYRDGLWSFIGVTGNTVVAPQYYSLVRTSTGEYIATSASGNCLLSANGQIITSTVSGYIRQMGQVFVVADAESERYYQDGQLVYEIANVSTTTSSMQEEIVEVFSDGYAVVYRGNSCGIRTLDGDTIFATYSFDGIIPLGEDGALFNEYGLALMQDFDSDASITYGIINRAGKVLSRDYQYISEFSDGYAWAATSDTQYQIIDGNGAIVAKVTRTMQLPEAFSNGVSVISDYTNAKHGLMTTAGKYMTSMLYSSIGTFNGKAAVATKQQSSSSSSLNMDYGLILADGTFKEVEGVSSINETSYGMHFVYTQYGLYGLIDSTGAFTTQANYQEIRPLSAFASNRDLVESLNEIPLYFARKNGLWGVMDAKGNVLVPFDNYYCAVYGESDGQIAISTDDDTYYIDVDTLTASHMVAGNASGVVSGRYILEYRGYSSLNCMSYADTAAGYATSVYGDVLVASDFLPTALLSSTAMSGDATAVITSAVTNFPTQYLESTPHQQLLYDFIGESMTAAAAKSTTSSKASISNTLLSRAGQVFTQGTATAEDVLADYGLEYARAYERVYRYTSTAVTDEISFRIFASSFYDMDAFELMTSFGGVRVPAEDILALEDTDVTITLAQKDGALVVTLPEGVSGTVILSAPATSYASIVDEDGTRVGGMAETFTGMLTAPIAGSGTYSVEETAIPFTDLSYLPREMKVAVSSLNAMGVVYGTTDTTFSADKTLSRAELCAMLLRLLAVSDHATVNQFTDLSTSDWYYQTALDANALGLMSGYEDNTYHGARVMTRAEVYSVLSRVLTDYQGYDVDETTTKLNSFLDGYMSGWATESTAICVNENLVIPQSDGTLSLNGQLTRGDAAVLLYRLAQLL